MIFSGRFAHGLLDDVFNAVMQLCMEQLCLFGALVASLLAISFTI